MQVLVRGQLVPRERQSSELLPWLAEVLVTALDDDGRRQGRTKWQTVPFFDRPSTLRAELGGLLRTNNKPLREAQLEWRVRPLSTAQQQGEEGAAAIPRLLRAALQPSQQQAPQPHQQQPQQQQQQQQAPQPQQEQAPQPQQEQERQQHEPSAASDPAAFLRHRLVLRGGRTPADQEACLGRFRAAAAVMAASAEAVLGRPTDAELVALQACLAAAAEAEANRALEMQVSVEAAMHAFKRSLFYVTAGLLRAALGSQPGANELTWEAIGDGGAVPGEPLFPNSKAVQDWSQGSECKGEGLGGSLGCGTRASHSTFTLSTYLNVLCLSIYCAP